MSKDENQFGATGKFPDGRLSDQDEGELRFGVAADPENGLVHIEFGKPVKSLALPPQDVFRLVRSLVDKANSMVGNAQGSARGNVRMGGTDAPSSLVRMGGTDAPSSLVRMGGTDAPSSLEGSSGLSYESIVSHRTFKGMVHLHWGAEGGQLELDEVRGLALALLDAASSAENDSLLLRFLTKEIAMPLTDAAKILDGMRHYRNENQEPEEAEIA